MYVFGEFIDWMSDTYGAKESHREHRGMVMAVYATSPLFFAGFALLYPNLWLDVFIALAAICYSVYLLYAGIPRLMQIPFEQGFLFASSAVAVGLVIVVSVFVGTVLLWSWGVGPVYTS